MNVQDEFEQYCKYWGLSHDFAEEAMKKAHDDQENSLLIIHDIDLKEVETKCVKNLQKPER